MPDVLTLANFLTKYREARGLNHREFAEAITQAGGKATTQAVQQWENRTPGQRTTRPALINREAIAKVLNCDLQELEDAYSTSRDAANTLKERDIEFVAYGADRVARKRNVHITYGPTRAQRLGLIEAAIRKYIPSADNYLEKEIAPFGVRRRYDYLSPKVAAEWVEAAPASPFFKQSYLESRLWRLMWLNRLDRDTAITRSYVLILVIATEEAQTLSTVKQIFTRLNDEKRLFSDFDQLTIAMATTPEYVARIIAHEEGLTEALTEASADS